MGNVINTDESRQFQKTYSPVINNGPLMTVVPIVYLIPRIVILILIQVLKFSFKRVRR